MVQGRDSGDQMQTYASEPGSPALLLVTGGAFGELHPNVGFIKDVERLLKTQKRPPKKMQHLKEVV